MDHKSSFAITPLTYAEGMIFVGLANGCVQAFDAVTLESLCGCTRTRLAASRTAPSPMRTAISTRLLDREDGNANFVCLTVTDEDPAKTDGISWPRGPTRPGRRLLLGGRLRLQRTSCSSVRTTARWATTGHARVLSFDPRSGRPLGATLTLPQTGDLRSSVTFVPGQRGWPCQYGYFTTKGGYLRSACRGRRHVHEASLRAPGY